MGSVFQFAAQLCNGNPEFKRNAGDKERIAKEPSIKTRASLVASPVKLPICVNTTDRSVGILSACSARLWPLKTTGNVSPHFSPA
jgi:hypothetical protein